ncbi:MAG: hypothetical protein ACKVQA_12245, partial [Burkholderiales bacterium]
SLLNEVDKWVDEDGELIKGELEELKIEIDSACDDISEVVEGLKIGRRDSADLASLLDWEQDIQQAMESVVEELERLSPNVGKHVGSVFEKVRLAAATLGESLVGRRDFYVYVHKDLEGRVFYVGKGTGTRATARARNAYWEQYVTERLDGKFEVEIVKEGLLEHESENIESDLIAQHGDALVNMQHGVRSGISVSFDAESMSVDMLLFGRKDHDEEYFRKLEECQAQREAVRILIEKAEALEEAKPSEATALYRKAIDATRNYLSNWPKEPGIKGELSGPLGFLQVELRPLDRLTLLHKKAGRLEELVETVDAFFSEFPGGNSGVVAEKIIKRSNAAKVLLAKKCTSYDR